jgi:hypothetical protein
MEQPLAQGTGSTRDASGANLSTVRGIAICAALGGLFLVVQAIIVALKPRGCIAVECVGRSYRESGPVDSILFLAALGLIIAAAIGLYWMHRFDGRGSRVVRIAGLVAAVSLLIGVGLTPAFFYVGFAALVVAILAFAVTGAGLMRSRVLPAWSGAMLVLTSLLLFAFNDQNERVLLVIPFGMTWMVLGGLLWSPASSPTSRWHARIQHA